MNVFPLESLTIEQATALQFKLVDAITCEFSGYDILTRGDLGLVPGLNQPKTTMKAEKVLASFFNAEDAMLIRGAGTNAIRSGLYALIGHGGTLLVHDAPIYPTTTVSIEMLGINTIKANYNDENELINSLSTAHFDAVLIQVTRQKLDDSYDVGTLIQTIKKIKPNTKIITDDNYSALKVAKIGSQLGASLSCFSSFKLLGPEGVGCIIGDSKYISTLKQNNYSGGGQIQGHEALDVLRGMVYAPVALAISSNVASRVCHRLNENEIAEIEHAQVVNAQSRVIVITLKEPIAQTVINSANQFGALSNPVGAESKYEISPLFYRVSGTFLKSNPDAVLYMIRINPNRAGDETILRILKSAIADVKSNLTEIDKK